MDYRINKLQAALIYIVCATVGLLPFHTIRIGILRFMKAKIGRKVGIYRGFEIRSPWKLTIGNSSVIGHNALLDARRGLTIGNNVNVSNEVMIWTLHHDYNSSTFASQGKEVIIEDYVWLCSRSVILPGVTVGRGAVVAAGAVVTRDVAPFTVVGGVPAKPIAKRNPELTYDLGNGVIPII